MYKNTVVYNKKFEFEAGGEIENLRVAYHSSTEKYEGQKVIWICHALTADSNPEEWWPELVGPGKLFDTERYFVVCGNMLGSCYGSSGPSDIDPKTGRPYFLDFPKVTVRDIVHGLDIVREHLGIEKIDLLVGASIGGFQALEYSIMFPDIIKRAVYIATLGRVTPWLSAFEESQRMAIEADKSFRACESLEGGSEGLKCARSIAMLSYRTEEGYNIKQWEDSDDVVFAGKAASYQRYQGKKLSKRFDAYSYWYLSYSVDSANIGRGRGGEKKALAMIKTRPVLIGIDTDLIFPSRSIRKMAEHISGSTFFEIKSNFGHDGFLIETQQIEDIIAQMLKEI